MLPLTAYAAKIATSTTGGAVVTMGAVFAQTDPLVTVGGAVGGIGLFSAGVYKLLADHTAQKALRESLEGRITRLEAEVDLERQAKVQWQTQAIAANAELGLLKAKYEEGLP